MSSSEIGHSKFSKGFSIPYFWRKNCDTTEYKEYFTNVRKSQVLIKQFKINELQGEETVIVKEIFQRRTKIIEYLHYISDNYLFKNETSFKAVQLFDLYLHKILKIFLSLNKVKEQTDKEEEIKELFTDFINYTTVYAILCLNVACKIEEINCNYLSFFNDNLLKKKFCFTIEELNRKETHIIKFLNFRTHIPSLFNFSMIFFQILIDIIFSDSIKFKNYREKLINELLNTNAKISKIYSSYNESMFNSALTSALICFKASIAIVSIFLRLNLASLHERFNFIISDYLKNEEYLKKVDQEAYKVFSKVQKLDILNNCIDQSIGCQ